MGKVMCIDGEKPHNQVHFLATISRNLLVSIEISDIFTAWTLGWWQGEPLPCEARMSKHPTDSEYVYLRDRFRQILGVEI